MHHWSGELNETTTERRQENYVMFNKIRIFRPHQNFQAENRALKMSTKLVGKANLRAYEAFEHVLHPPSQGIDGVVILSAVLVRVFVLDQTPRQNGHRVAER